jgi:hypothetical protein
MTDIHSFDQALARADQALTKMVEHYRMLDGEHGEVANVGYLVEDLADNWQSEDLAPLLAAAIRRLAKADFQ